LLRSRQVGVARVVLQNKQHLAVVVPSGQSLILNMLRWGDEIRPWEDLDLPPEGSKAAGVSDKELSMTTQLINEISSSWDPHQFADSFKEEILALVDRKVKAGESNKVIEVEAAPEETAIPFGAQILDLMDLLQRSLHKGNAKGKKKALSYDRGPENDGTDNTPPQAPHVPQKRRSA